MDAQAEAEAEDTKATNDIHLDHLCQDISQFAASLCAVDVDKSQPLETPKYLDDFLDTIESKLQCYESSASPPARFLDSITLFIKLIDRLALLINSVSKFRSVSNSAAILLNLATSQLHRAMLVLGDELVFLLHKQRNGASDANPEKDENANANAGGDHTHEHQPAQHQHQQQQHQESEISQQQQQQPDSIQQQTQEQESDSSQEQQQFPPYSPEDISMINSIIKTMILAGYRVECTRVLMIARRGALEGELECEGLEKMSIDEAQWAQWETLEAEIATWIRVFKRCTSHLFPGELQFYRPIFSEFEIKPKSQIWMVLFSDLTSSVIHQLINLTHAVAMTKRSSEKLFKFLDMHGMLRDLGLWLDESFESESCDCVQELRSELAAASSRLGQAAVSILCELKSSIIIININTKQQPVACGAIDPLTHNTMDYLNHACEYTDTLEELFLRHLNTSSSGGGDDDKVDPGGSGSGSGSATPFTAELMSMLNSLEANLVAKSKLYKDPSLRYIFMMNNVSYILQKMKGSTAMSGSSSWRRKRSTDVRSYHKNYQRDTWSKVLQCLAQEGLMVNGKVQKPVLKERFKNFNQLFDEIHKTQSIWVVSDEQLQSELRVSITAVILPAYRAFLARFGHIFTPGRQYEKHIKYQPEDIEAAIEDLFDGRTSN